MLGSALDLRPDRGPTLEQTDWVFELKSRVKRNRRLATRSSTSRTCLPEPSGAERASSAAFRRGSGAPEPRVGLPILAARLPGRRPRGYPGRRRPGGPARPSLPDGTVDGILCEMVLEHVPDARRGARGVPPCPQARWPRSTSRCHSCGPTTRAPTTTGAGPHLGLRARPRRFETIVGGPLRRAHDDPRQRPSRMARDGPVASTSTSCTASSTSRSCRCSFPSSSSTSSCRATVTPRKIGALFYFHGRKPVAVPADGRAPSPTAGKPALRRRPDRAGRALTSS